MKPSDLAIYVAIGDIYDDLETPRGRRWMLSVAGRRELARRVLAVIEPGDEMVSKIGQCFDNYGKRRKELQQLIDVAKRDGPRCCWRCHRPEIKCSEDLTVEHIIPRSRGGSDDLRNLWISCKTHNSRRGDMSVEDFVDKGLNP